MKSYLWLLVLGLFIASYSLFSYSLTAPNLILSSWSPYWQFQTTMWKNFFNNRELLAQTFITIISGLWLSYAVVLLTGKKWLTSLSMKSATLIILAISLPLILASNALSYDIFNYLFNAKMVVVYHADPHHAVALDFAYDDWVRFMHNTHTPAPYGYGWTVLSLLPYTLGFGKLLSTWLSFKAFSWLSYFLLAVVYWHTVESKNKWWLWVVLLNPLVLIEIIGNSHNDLWMLVPAMTALVMVRQKKSFKIITLSLLLLSISISIKLASIVLAPIWLLLLLNAKNALLKPFAKLIAWGQEQWAWIASVGLFLPLFTERSKYFLPWYIAWSLVWLPFFAQPKSAWLQKAQQLWQCLLIGFTISSLFRYLPFLWQGNYNGQVVPNQIMITWVGGVVLALVLMLAQALYRQQVRSGRMAS